MKPQIRKLGTIDLDLVETMPIVFKGRLYRFEYVRERYWANTTGESYFRFIEQESGTVCPPFAQDYHQGNVFVDRDTLFVTSTNAWGGEKIDILGSQDMQHWDSWNAFTLPGYGLFNTSVCRAGDQMS